ncbi:14067_t:CDS:1, partial [Gigaspora rosea]
KIEKKGYKNTPTMNYTIGKDTKTYGNLKKKIVKRYNEKCTKGKKYKHTKKGYATTKNYISSKIKRKPNSPKKEVSNKKHTKEKKHEAQTRKKKDTRCTGKNQNHVCSENTIAY